MKGTQLSNLLSGKTVVMLFLQMGRQAENALVDDTNIKNVARQNKDIADVIGNSKPDRECD